MKVAQLSGLLRANVGKKDASSLRKAERIPGVLYGMGTQTHFSVKKTDLEKIVFSPDVYQIALDVEGQKSQAIIREIQQHPVKDTILHVDFLELSDTKPVKVGLPVVLQGSSRGVMAGGKLMQVFRTLKVVGLPGDLPEAIVLDITPLRIGHAIRIKDVQLPGVTILDPANAVIVSVKRARGSVDDSQDEEG